MKFYGSVIIEKKDDGFIFYRTGFISVDCINPQVLEGLCSK